MPRIRTAMLVLLVTASLSGIAVPAQAAAATINVLMPFAGKWDGFGEAPPSSHLGKAEEGDFATDIHAAAGTAVQTRVTVPKGSTVVLKVLSVVPLTCDGKSAGKTVRVEVQADGKALGWASYGHLDQVPGAVKAGAKLSNGATLGKLKLWPKSGCWQVTNPGGVHTHFKLASYRPNFACYRALKSKQAYSADTWVGQVGKTRATKKGQAC